MEVEEILFCSFSNFMRNQAYLGLPQVKETCEQLSWQDIRLHTEGIRGHLEAFIAQLQKIQTMLIVKTESPGEIEPNGKNMKSTCSEMHAADVITIKSEAVDVSENCKRKRFCVPEVESERPDLDPNLVQVRADKQEIERRIQAFLERKKVEINEENRREFCNTINKTEDGESCARTDAVFIPRPGSCSHVPVTRVINAHGPQTRPPVTSSPKKAEAGPAPVSVKLEPGTLTTAVQERLANMERHLRTKAGDSKDVFARLQHLEDRILYLESLSPEYFTYAPPIKRHKPQKPVSEKGPKAFHNLEGLTLREIEERISSLKTRLRTPDIAIKQENMDA